jgi:DNA polymerase III epsilon subunit-like protein
MINCYFCKKEIKTKSAYISHLKFRKKACIEESYRWLKQKKIILDNFLKDNISFDRNQLNFINSDLQDCKLLGIPGGGKTRCIIEKIKKCFQEKIFTNNFDFLILTFSKRSRFDFLNKGKEISKNFNQNNVRTLHSIAGHILQKLYGRTSSSLETVVLACLRFLETSDVNLKLLKLLKNIKVIFVDEAQDISNNQYKFILKLKEKLECKLILVGDPNQNIYQFQGGSDQFLLSYDVKTFNLVNNYRSNKEIVGFISGISPHQTKMISKYNKNDNKVNIFEGTIDEIENDIIKEIMNTKIDLSKVAIIGPVKRCNVKNNSYLNLGLSLVANCLSKNKIPFLKQYTDTHNMKFDTDKIITLPNHVNLFTIHGSKGLEFDKVYLLNYHLTTFGKIPTIDDYNVFKYMWYVGVSRSKNYLKIYKDKSKIVWPLTVQVNNKLYNCNTKLKFLNEIKFKKEFRQLRFNVTDYLEDMRAEQLFRYETGFKFETDEIILYKKRKDLVDYKNLSNLYGQFIETVYEYYYHYFNDNVDNNNFLERFLFQLNNTIIIDTKYQKTCQILLKRLNINYNTKINLKLFEINKYMLSHYEMEFYEFLKKELKFNYERRFYVSFENKVTNQSNKEIIKLCKNIIKNYKKEDMMSIFKIVLFKYQLDNESGYLFDLDFTTHLEKIQPIILKIKEFCERKIYQNLEFQHYTEHPNFPMIGILDAVDFKNKKIIDIKFTKSFHIKQAFQLLLYYNNLIPDWKEKYELEIVNFYTGKIYKIKFHDCFNNYDLLKSYVDITQTKIKNTLFCYDLETTGLNIEKLEIIERYFEEYNLGFVPSEGLIKPSFYISDEISSITKITNQMLENAESIHIFKNELRNIFNYCEKPKFMAHNGSVFDHRILFKSLNQQQLLDSRYIIRLLYHQDTLKLNLSETYKLVTGNEVINCHRAKDDVKMMIEILKKINYSEIY